jgi:hypothetical protein
LGTPKQNRNGAARGKSVLAMISSPVASRIDGVSRFGAGLYRGV